ncbi:MAG: HisA/HisF-related TIM barrel protein [Methanotrichaceae archaeon]
MRCIFVLDLFNGAVVHAVRGGERSRYEAVERFSRIATSSNPIEVIGKIRPKEVYVADLNMLMGKGDNLAIIKKISRLAKTMADIGASQISDLGYLPKDISPILGTETASLRFIQETSLFRDITVSIDIKNGKILTEDPGLICQEPLDFLRRLNEVHLEAVILLDLDRVGVSSGLNKKFLEKAVSVSDHSLILGGGISDTEDLKLLEEIGFKGALTATAVHNGRIPLEILR